MVPVRYRYRCQHNFSLRLLPVSLNPLLFFNHSDEDETLRNERNEPKPICRFFNKGQCTWGSSCRFLHPGVLDKVRSLRAAPTLIWFLLDAIGTGSVADLDPWNPYHFPVSGSVSKNGWIRNPDPYQMIRIRIQLKPLKT